MSMPLLGPPRSRPGRQPLAPSPHQSLLLVAQLPVYRPARLVALLPACRLASGLSLSSRPGALPSFPACRSAPGLAPCPAARFPACRLARLVARPPRLSPYPAAALAFPSCSPARLAVLSPDVACYKELVVQTGWLSAAESSPVIMSIFSLALFCSLNSS